MEESERFSKSWSGDVRYMVADEEKHSLLPRGQRQLVSRKQPSFEGVMSRSGSGPAEANRSLEEEEEAGSVTGISYGSIQRKRFNQYASRRRFRKSNNILDGMIKSEKYLESSNRRYMVPQFQNEEDDGNYTSKALLPAVARVIEYENGTMLYDAEVSDFNMYLERRKKSAQSILWLHIEGPPEAALRVLGERFKVHPLAQEDVCTTPQRPKLDQYEEMLLVITHSPELLEEGPGSYEFALNQVSIFSLYSKNILVTFHEHRNATRGNWLQRVLDRVRNNTEKVREKDLSHLLYAVLDSVTDRYFPLLEFYGDRMEEIESALVDDPDPDLIKGITRLKRDLLLIRRTIWPMRECTSRLMVLSDDLVKKATKMYLRDLQDHLVQVVDILETYRDVSMSLLDLYLSATNNKMQEVMKTLTIISTIFIPLTFITGVYGMNFEVKLRFKKKSLVN